MNIHAKRMITYVFMAAAAFVTVIGGSQSAEAGSCSVGCPGGPCSIKKLFRGVICYCDSNGNPVCTTAFRRTSEPVEMVVASDGVLNVIATDQQLADIKESIATAEAFEYVSLADAAARVYEALENGDAAVYADALSAYEAELNKLTPEDWTRLEAVSQ